MEIVQGKIGSEANYKVEVVESKLSIGVQYEGQLAGSSLEIHVGLKQVLEALKLAIKGPYDDMAIDALEKALGL